MSNDTTPYEHHYPPKVSTFHDLIDAVDESELRIWCHALEDQRRAWRVRALKAEEAIERSASPETEERCGECGGRGWIQDWRSASTNEKRCPACSNAASKTAERQCQRCWHFEGEHLSPAIDLGLPVSGDSCQWGGCDCREFVPESRPSQGVEGETARDGASLIMAERRRQVESEGWEPEHDQEHDRGELASAAVVYAMEHRDRELCSLAGTRLQHLFWPLNWTFKPTPDDRVRELVKAGALISAEIDRLNGTSPAAVPPPPEPLCETCGGEGVLFGDEEHIDIGYGPADAQGNPTPVPVQRIERVPIGDCPDCAHSEAAGSAVNPGFCPLCLKPEDYCVCNTALLHETFPAVLREPVAAMRFVALWIDQEADYMCGHMYAEECPDEESCSLGIHPDAMSEALTLHADNLARAKAARPSEAAEGAGEWTRVGEHSIPPVRFGPYARYTRDGEEFGVPVSLEQTIAVRFALEQYDILKGRAERAESDARRLSEELTQARAEIRERDEYRLQMLRDLMDALGEDSTIARPDSPVDLWGDCLVKARAARAEAEEMRAALEEEAESLRGIHSDAMDALNSLPRAWPNCLCSADDGPCYFHEYLSMLDEAIPSIAKVAEELDRARQSPQEGK